MLTVFGFIVRFVLVLGLEHRTSRLRTRVVDLETAEAGAVQAIKKPLETGLCGGGPCRARTYDPLIKSQLLCQLS